MNNICKDCGKYENEERQINDCQHCGEPVCEDCAEIDCDGSWDGFSTSYRVSQWVCDPCLHPEAYKVTEFPERHPELKALWEVESERQEG